jgi:hypothetical protein
MDGWMEPSFFGQKKNLFFFPQIAQKMFYNWSVASKSFSPESPQIFSTSGPSFNAMFMDGPH